MALGPGYLSRSAASTIDVGPPILYTCAPSNSTPRPPPPSLAVVMSLWSAAPCTRTHRCQRNNHTTYPARISAQADGAGEIAPPQQRQAGLAHRPRADKLPRVSQQSNERP